MTMNTEFVTVVANGVSYEGFKKVSVQSGLDMAVRVFGLETTEAPFGTLPKYAFPPGTAMQIYASPTRAARGDLLVDGYVNAYRPSFSSKSQDAKIEGRSKGQEWVDSSAVHDTSSWQGKTPIEIANELNDSGIKITAKVPLEAEEDWNLYQGESGFATVERMLRHQRASQMGLANGDIEITNASVAGRHATALIEGRNIFAASGQLMDLGLYSDTIVKGQSRLGTGAGAMRISERYKNGTVKRLRRKVLIFDGHTTISKAKRRAIYDAERAQGFSVRATIVAHGFRDDSGKLWSPNNLVLVESPILKIFGDMLIERATFSQQEAEGGSLTELGLVHPSAHGGSAGRVSKTDPIWNGPF